MSDNDEDFDNEDFEIEFDLQTNCVICGVRDNHKTTLSLAMCHSISENATKSIDCDIDFCENCKDQLELKIDFIVDFFDSRLLKKETSVELAESPQDKKPNRKRKKE